MTPLPAGAAPPPVASGRGRAAWRLAPLLALAAGVVYLAWLLTLVRPGVFFNGDAGLKLLLVEQFARGELAPDLRLPGEPWVQELWRSGYFPFGWPFIFRSGEAAFAWCPLPFEYLTAPAVALFGWRGLYLWPAVGVLATWIALLRLGRHLDLGPAPTALALFALIFCSPVTAYGAIFWEHAPAVALAVWGLALLQAPALRAPTLNGLLAGVLLGLSVWFRAELVWLAFVACALVLLSPRLGLGLRGRAGFLAGVALAGVGLLAWNAGLYGDPLGVTSRLVREEPASHGIQPEPLARMAAAIARLLAVHGPAMILGVLVAIPAAAPGTGDDRARGALRFWALGAAAFALGVVLFLPRLGYSGDKQLGPRHLLVFFPMGAVALAIAVGILLRRAGSGRRALLGLLLAATLGAGAWFNAARLGASLSWDYANRIRPMLEAVRSDPARVVVVTEQYMAQELAALFGEKRFFWTGGAADAEPLLLALAAAGQGRFLAVAVAGSIPNDRPSTHVGAASTLRLRPMGCLDFHRWCLFDARVSVAGR